MNALTKRRPLESTPFPVNTRDRFQDSDLVCNCRKVTAGELRLLVRGGLRTSRGLIARTEASTGCQSCAADLEELICDEVEALEAEARANSPQLNLFTDSD